MLPELLEIVTIIIIMVIVMVIMLVIIIMRGWLSNLELFRNLVNNY